MTERSAVQACVRQYFLTQQPCAQNIGRDNETCPGLEPCTSRFLTACSNPLSCHGLIEKTAALSVTCPIASSSCTHPPPLAAPPEGRRPSKREREREREMPQFSPWVRGGQLGFFPGRMGFLALFFFSFFFHTYTKNTKPKFFFLLVFAILSPPVRTP